MSETVTAAVATEALTTELKKFPIPEIGPDEGLLQIEVAGVCGTDWEIYGRKSRGHGLGPLILGHENVGRIAAVGERAAERWGVKVGDRVAVEEFIPCGHCRLCRSGQYRICEATDSRSKKPFLRYGSVATNKPPALWGGFSEYQYLHPNSIIYPIGPDVPGELAALFVPISNGIRWVVQEGGGTVGETIVVQGPGQHGLGCVVAAKEVGMKTIILVGLSQDAGRLEVGRELGADYTIEVDREDLVARVEEITGGEMLDMVVDTTPGAVSAVEAALEVTAKRGRIILAGGKHGKPASFLNDTVVRKELVIRGVRGHDHRSVEPAIEIIKSGRYPLELMSTHRLSLEEVDKALRIVGERADPEAIHVNVVPD
jgi:threonine dehydrogenase-like Zn-dependent dehydrogenase